MGVGLELAKRGVSTVTNIEQSQKAVQRMKEEDKENLCRWDCDDVTKMAYPNDGFDYVVDKAVPMKFCARRAAISSVSPLARKTSVGPTSPDSSIRSVSRQSTSHPHPLSRVLMRPSTSSTSAQRRSRGMDAHHIGFH